MAAQCCVTLVQGRAQTGGDVGVGVLAAGAPAQVRLRSLEQAGAVKSAAAAWLRACGEQARFDFSRSDGAPVGSVVDIQIKNRRLRVHLDGTVAPVWDEGSESVLGVSVPVDRGTLIDRWYVHRIRLDSEGTVRRVKIGTEAFARSVEWFGLDDCAMTKRGLSTPAVERITKSRRTPPPTRWTPGKAQKVPPPPAAILL